MPGLPLLSSDSLKWECALHNPCIWHSIPSTCDLWVLFTCLPRNFLWSVFLPQLVAASRCILFSYGHAFPKHRPVHECSRGVDWKWRGRAILSHGSVSHCLLWKCSPEGTHSLSQVIKGFQSTSKNSDGEGVKEKISLCEKCCEKVRRCFFLVVYLWKVFTAWECLIHIQKYLAEQSGTALMLGLVGVCIPVVVTSILP